MEYQNMEELYSYLESDTKRARRQWQLTSDFKLFAKSIADEDNKKKIAWESYVFDFVLEKGKVKPLHSTTQKDGIVIWQYPAYEDFSDEAYEYLMKRSREVSNDYLIARYNQVLWNSPTKHKHHEQAKSAIDAYLRLLESLNCGEDERKEGFDCLDTLKNGFSLSLQIGYKTNEFKRVIQSFLFVKGKFSDNLKVLILKFMLEQSQLKKESFTGTLDLILKLGRQKKKDKPDYFQTKDLYETAVLIAQKLGSDTKIWNQRIGDAICRMAEYRMDDKSRMIPLTFYQDAMSYYKLAGSKKKLKAVADKYSQLRRELKLGKVEVPFDEKYSDALFKYLDAKSQKLLEREPKEILDYLTSGEDVFPRKDWLKESTEIREQSLLDLFTTMKFDINKNVSKEAKGNKLNARVYENYNYYLRLLVLPYLHRIFIDGQLKGKVTFESVANYLATETWLGQTIAHQDSGGDPTPYDWISVIAPSLLEYFIQTESALKSSNPYSNYILAIDSLTLKFEGVLRDFARFCKVSITTLGKKNILREKYIEELLAEKELQRFFNEDDILLFNFLFISKNGMNLRNNVAHCFFRYENYSYQIMHLLICAFLRIGKYKLATE